MRFGIFYEHQNPRPWDGERSEHTLKGRDGSRVPLPWTAAGTSYGFGADGAHLPQPGWFADVAVDVQRGTEGSTLELYREALRLRRQLQTTEHLSWVPNQAPDVLHFTRPEGWPGGKWHCVTNFGTAPVPLPEGVVRVSSGPQTPGELPGETTVWLTDWPHS